MGKIFWYIYEVSYLSVQKQTYVLSGNQSHLPCMRITTIKNQNIINVGADEEKLELLCTVGGNVK